MLESGLFFTLGFLASALLALMIAPAIWRRAVALTRQRIESSVPLTLNEIQADKDQLRAEFAMSTRRLEVSLEDLKERAAEQMIEINRRRDEVLALEDVQSKKEERINELKEQSDQLRAEMRGREEKLSQSSLELANVESRLQEKTAETDAMENRYREVVEEFDNQRNELVASESKLGGVNEEARALKAKLKSMQESIATLNEEKKAADSGLQREKNRALELEKKITRFQSTTTDMEARLERRDRDIAKLREKSGGSDEKASASEDQLTELQAENVKLKTELAEAALRADSLANAPDTDTAKNAAALFDNERQELMQRIETIETERDAMRTELSAIQISSGDDWETERRENAVVRERINDLAAQVTAMTASIEGPDSPVNDALAREKAASPTLAVSNDDKPVASLADRIRAVQQAAEKA